MITKPSAMLDFKPLTPADKQLYESYLIHTHNRGCEVSFANLYLWGRQSMAVLGPHILLFSQFNQRSVYPFPVGPEEEESLRVALDAIIEDAHTRGIPCRITGLTAKTMEIVSRLYPGRFHFHCERGSYDYVYDIHALADLKGKAYHGKRNHLNRFWEAHPDCVSEPLTEANLPLAEAMAEEWYRVRQEEDPEGDYLMEHAALKKAFRRFGELAMEGLLLRDGETVLALTLGSRLTDDTFDVQFEKARADVQGAYPAINQEFARYLREKYPKLLYLDREEDMGLEGLRRAKLSYHPHHLIEKCWCCLLEDGYDY